MVVLGAGLFLMSEVRQDAVTGASVLRPISSLTLQGQATEPFWRKVLNHSEVDY